MVSIIVKKEMSYLFRYEATPDMKIADMTREIAIIYNGTLKVKRIASEFEELAKYGISLPPDMQGLNEEQIRDLKLKDEWTPKCYPMGGFTTIKDPFGRRNGQIPTADKQTILLDSAKKAKEMVTPMEIVRKHYLNKTTISKALDELAGAVHIVYPMGLPPYDPIYQELHNTEQLEGTQASMEVIDPAKAVLWFSGKQMLPEKTLKEYSGSGGNTSLTVKLGRQGDPAPSRTQIMDEPTRRMLMAKSYQRQEELKKLEQDDDDQYFDSAWADGQRLKRDMHGLNNIQFNFRK